MGAQRTAPPPPPTSCLLPSLQFKLPDVDQRRSILRLTLAKHAAEMNRLGAAGIDPALLNDGHEGAGELARVQGTSTQADERPLTRLAEQTEGFSGSDLNELCSQAATLPVHDAIRL